MADDLITLVVPEGAAYSYPISHGIQEWFPYRADTKDPASRWWVDVPRDVAQYFLHNGGFSMAQTSFVLRSAGTTPVMYPDGRQFTVGPGGLLVESYDRGDGMHVGDVPIEFLGELVAHGLVPAPQDPTPSTAKKGRKAASGVVQPSSSAPAPITPLVADSEGTPHPEVPSDKEWDGLTRDRL
jgi:hypothetical protein